MVRRLIRIAPALLAVACATARAEPSVSDPLSRGLTAMEGGRWSEAENALHESAARCESGMAGVDALLLLAASALDPANLARDPDAAARYAAHVIVLPEVEAVRLEMARALYRAALDAGAGVPAAALGAVRNPRPAPGVAERFTDCGRPGARNVTERALPTYPGVSLARQLAQSRARADSLAAMVDSAGAAAERVVIVREGGAPVAAGGDQEVARLQARVEALEAELERIRRLLRKGGG